jgi:hypothetical protein
MSVHHRLEQYLDRLQSQKFNKEIAQEFLQFVRENQLRESVHVVKYGSQLLKKHASTLGDSGIISMRSYVC